MTKSYNKLVRDKIPEIIASTGKKVRISIINGNEYLNALKEKLHEEIAELMHALKIVDFIENEIDQNSPEAEAIREEFADVYEVLETLEREYWRIIKMDTVKKVKEEKAKNKGSFHKHIFLEAVED